MNMMGLTATDAQIVFQGLETTEHLYRLVWDDQAALEQRYCVIAVSLTAAGKFDRRQDGEYDGERRGRDQFVLSVCEQEEPFNIGYLPISCAVLSRCSKLQRLVCTSRVTNATKSDFQTSGLAVTPLADCSEIGVYCKGESRAVTVSHLASPPIST